MSQLTVCTAHQVEGEKYAKDHGDTIQVLHADAVLPAPGCYICMGRKPDDALKALFPSMWWGEPIAVAHEAYRGSKRFPNPHPPRNQGGDCFNCALTAALRTLFPDREIAWEEVYKVWENDKFPGQLDNSWPTYLKVFDRIHDRLGLKTEAGILFSPPFVGWDLENWEPAWFKGNHQIRWWRDLHAYLSAGWVALAHVNQLGRTFGGYDEHGWHKATDHVVLIDGARMAKRVHTSPHTGETWEMWDREIHVVDSARSDSTGWHDVDQYLWRHGASALHILRRSELPEDQGIVSSRS